MHDSLNGITWFRGSSVRIRRKGVEIHVDPLAVNEDSKADLVLLTHPHYDNFSEDDIARVRDPDTVIVAPSTMKKLLDDADHFMRPGDMLQLDGFDILAVPTKNIAPASTNFDLCWKIVQRIPPSFNPGSAAASVCTVWTVPGFGSGKCDSTIHLQYLPYNMLGFWGVLSLIAPFLWFHN